MGYRVEAYSLAELRRISAPGAVVPSLFWLLPVGTWQPREIDQLWQHFTDPQSGYCHDLGLALVKNLLRSSERDVVPVDLSSLTAQLDHMVPEGAREYLPRERAAVARQLLFLSGAYPQPGWGLLVDSPEHELKDIVDQIVLGAVNALIHISGGQEAIAQIRSATAAFHQLETVASRTPEEPATLSDDQKRLQALRSYGTKLHAIREALDRGDVNAFENARQGVVSPEGFDGIKALDEKLIVQLKLALLLTCLTDTGIRQGLIATLHACALDGGRDVGDAVRKAREAGHWKIVKMWMGLKKSAPPIETIFTWADEFRSEIAKRVITEIEVASANVEKPIGALGISVARQEEEHAKAIRRHHDDVSRARRLFQKALHDASLPQWEWGPRFLMEVERLCRREHIHCNSICWDPARMIGWKVWSLGVNVTVEDLYIKTRRLLEGVAGVTDPSQSGHEIATGSYFTDYVHYVASHDLKKSPRDVTEIFLASLLRPHEKRGLFEALYEPFPEGIREEETTSRLLYCLGWPPILGDSEKPLTACLTQETGDWTVPAALSGNDVRIAAESFCKDLIDVMASILGYDEGALWNTVLGARPEYKKSFPKWQEEIASVTIGSGIIILRALGPLSFPSNGTVVSCLVQNLQTLSDVLNPASHHQEAVTKQQLDYKSAGKCLRVVLDSARELVKEMPWHFTVLQTTGQQPKVLTGKAWSHSHPEERMIRIMLWSGDVVGAKVVVWNPSCTNPIITDPRILRRPR